MFFNISSNPQNPIQIIFKKIESGDIASVKGFLDLGVSANATDNSWCLLHIAARHNQKEVAKLLLDSGADVNIKSWCESTPLHYAAYCGHLEVVKLLIDCGANINAKDRKGITPLYKAACWGKIEMVALLISLGADINVKTNSGYTVLHTIASNIESDCFYEHPVNNRIEIIKLLLNLGIDKETKNNDNKIATDIANYPEIQQIISNYAPN